MKKLLVSLVAIFGAISLLIAILVLPNLVVREGQGIVKTVDIYQDIDFDYPSSIIGNSGLTGRTVIYSNSTYEFILNMPTQAELSRDYDISISDGETLNGVQLLVPLFVRLNENFYGGFFSSPWGTEILSNFANGSFNVTITRNGNQIIYSNIVFEGYYISFSSSSSVRLITFVVNAQEEALDFAPELQKPVLEESDNTLDAIYDGFSYIGDWFVYISNYIKFIYAYFEIPIKLYFVG